MPAASGVTSVLSKSFKSLDSPDLSWDISFSDFTGEDLRSPVTAVEPGPYTTGEVFFTGASILTDAFGNSYFGETGT